MYKMQKIIINKFDKNLISNIKNIVAKYGVCIIENFINLKELESLKIELNQVLSSNIEKNREIKSNYTVMKKLSFNSIKNFEKIYDFCNYDLFKNLAGNFFNTNNLNIREEVYMHRDENGADRNIEWHQDPQVSIKFFLYLQDTDETNGAMQYSLGSHSDGIYRLKSLRLMGQTTPTYGRTEDFISTPVILSAKAGSLLVFNTAGFHKAGNIEKGKKREVIRVHFSKKYPKSIIFFNSFLKTLLFSKSLRTRIIANLGFTGAEMDETWFPGLKEIKN